MVKARVASPPVVVEVVADGPGWIELELLPEWVLSDEALERLGSLNKPIKLERDEEGRLIISFPAGGFSPDVGGRILAQVIAWSDSGQGGRVMGPDGGQRADAAGRAVRSPDISWLSPERLSAFSHQDQLRGFLQVCPDFVVEVISPDDRIVQQQAKMRMWIDYGVRLGWLIDWQRGRAAIYRADQTDPDWLLQPPTLSGEGVLPGLLVDMTRIWEWGQLGR